MRLPRLQTKLQLCFWFCIRGGYNATVAYVPGNVLPADTPT
jgi:hypothetical protein